MSDKERQKKDGQDKNKKNQRRRTGQAEGQDSAATIKANVARPKTFDEDDEPGQSGSTSASRTARAKAAKEVKGK